MNTVATKERPILFSAEMVRAILDGRKTQTRRALKTKPPDGWSPMAVERYFPAIEDRDGMMTDGPEIFGAYDEEWGVACPYGGPGDRLWVRESWNQLHCVGNGAWVPVSKPQQKSKARLVYAASVDSTGADRNPIAWSGPWRTSIHLPRWASRLTLEITGVRVERLQEISGDDCSAEGIEPQGIGSDMAMRAAYAELWNKINGAGSWDANPFVWVIEFTKQEPA